MPTFVKHLPALIVFLAGLGTAAALGADGTLTGPETIGLIGTFTAIGAALVGVKIGATASSGGTTPTPAPPAPAPAPTPSVQVVPVPPPPPAPPPAG